LGEEAHSCINMKRFLLPSIVAVLFSPPWAHAAVTNVIGDGAFWNTVPSWQTLSLDDPDDGVIGSRDIVGNATFPAIQYAQTSSYIYFRMQIDSTTIPTNSSYMIYIDKVGVGTANVPDFAFAWDCQSADITKHGLEMTILSTSGTTWGDITMDDIDGSGTSKGTKDINGIGGTERPTDGYLRVLDATTGFSGTNLNSYIEMAVSWSYLTNNSTSGLAPGQQWRIGAGVIANATDHGAINANGDIAGNASSATLLSAGGWSSAITTIPEPSSSLLCAIAASFALLFRRQRSQLA
jgi:hypothetical protein